MSLQADVKVTKVEPPVLVTARIEVAMSAESWREFSRQVGQIDRTCPFNIMKQQLLDFVKKEVG